MNSYIISFVPEHKNEIINTLNHFKLKYVIIDETHLYFVTDRPIENPFVEQTPNALNKFLFTNYFNKSERIAELIIKYEAFSKERGIDLKIDHITKEFVFTSPHVRDNYSIFTLEVCIEHDIENFDRIMLFIFNTTNICMYRLKMIKYLHSINSNITNCDEFNKFTFPCKNSKYSIQIWLYCNNMFIDEHCDKYISYKYEEMPEFITDSIIETYTDDNGEIDEFSNYEAENIRFEVNDFEYEFETEYQVSIYGDNSGPIGEWIEFNEIKNYLDRAFAEYGNEIEDYEPDDETGNVIIVNDDCPSF